MARPLNQIAQEIYKDWKNLSPHAEPYLSAMSTLETVNDDYHSDSAVSVVAYFLLNASSWRGEVAKRIKTELKLMIAGK